MKSRLALEAPGAGIEQLTRGVAAAEAVFARHQTTALEVAVALAAREHDEHAGAFVPPEEWSDSVPPKPTVTSRQMEIADVWYEADAAAVNACYAEASERPAVAQLVLLREELRTLSRH